MYKLMPKKYRVKIEEMLMLLGSEADPARFFNYSLAVSFALGFLVAYLVQVYFFLVWTGVFLGLFFLFHGFLIIMVDRRTSFVENILPDALQLMAANSRAGYIPSRALLLSARKEFGPLSEAIKNMGKELMTGMTMEKALKTMGRRIKSDVFRRTVKLITEGIKSGGHFASLLDENANDIRRMQTIKKEMKANMMMYIIFIFFAACIGAPLLYSLSTFLIGTISKLGGATKIPEDVAGQVPFAKFGTVQLSSEFLTQFSLTAIIITTVFGGLILGLISSGREKAGIKYIPVLVVVAIIVYFLTGMMVNSMFGTMVPGV